eukprot:scaffold1332_cov166-Amphora_coffeaeformis.AAC.17
MVDGGGEARCKSDGKRKRGDVYCYHTHRVVVLWNESARDHPAWRPGGFTLYFCVRSKTLPTLAKKAHKVQSKPYTPGKLKLAIKKNRDKNKFTNQRQVQPRLNSIVL